MIHSENYTALIVRLKNEIQKARIKAALSANIHLIALYWKIGKTVLESQTAEQWGAKVIDRLAADLKSAFPDMKGISPHNLKYMRAFANAYPNFLHLAAKPDSKANT